MVAHSVVTLRDFSTTRDEFKSNLSRAALLIFYRNFGFLHFMDSESQKPHGLRNIFLHQTHFD